MGRPKPKSKRTPVRLRHKIEKASLAKQRKDRKAAKKNPEWRSRLKKDPGIPNLFPLKDKILQQIQDDRIRKAVEEVERKGELERQTEREKLSDGKGEDAMMDVEGEDEAGEEANFSNDDEDMADDGEEDEADDEDPLAALLASAQARATEYEAEHSSDGMDHDGSSDESSDDEDAAPSGSIAVAPTRKETSRKAFDKVFKQVVDQADVVLYVLDARDPNGTRSREVERSILQADNERKRLVLVLNKIDLVPPHVLKGWLGHLRNEFPTVPLKAAGAAANAHTFNHRELTIQGTSTALFKALKAYAHSKQQKSSINVGVIGYPNVGKSSVINALTSRMGGSKTACPTGAEAGVTTGIRSVKIDGRLRLIDSPGIVFPGDSEEKKPSKAEEHARLVLLNTVPPKQIDDPITPVTMLLKRLSQTPELEQKMLDYYGLPALISDGSGDRTTDFLVQVARKRGRLGKGGVPNLGSAAMTVVTDWRDGRIQGWTDPPPKRGTDGQSEEGERKAIVKQWAKEFMIDGLWGDGKDVVPMEVET
ncbi:MAG: hypothetical protein M1814_004513 [Vezdaea aestivalis]|nr:MAG: hypothetical protein M1814_004513 [Vezdaea aestivalis]